MIGTCFTYLDHFAYLCTVWSRVGFSFSIKKLDVDDYCGSFIIGNARIFIVGVDKISNKPTQRLYNQFHNNLTEEKSSGCFSK